MNATEAEAVRRLLRMALGERPAADTVDDARTVAASLTPLSGRQLQVLQLVADGLTEAQIARQLRMAFATTKTHKAAVFKALNARSAAHAVAIAFRQGLLR